MDFVENWLVNMRSLAGVAGSYSNVELQTWCL